MTENMKKFLEKLSSDKALAERVGRMNSDEIIRAAGELGIVLTDEDFAEQEAQGALSDEELDCVVGGDKCGCVVWGVGKSGGKNSGLKKCTCTNAGGGDFDDKNKTQRCFCLLGGGGVDH